MDDLEEYVEKIGAKRKANDNDDLVNLPIEPKKGNNSVKKDSAAKAQKKERRVRKDKTEKKQRQSKVEGKSISYCEMNTFRLELFTTGSKKMGTILTVTDHSKVDQTNGKFLHCVM